MRKNTTIKILPICMLLGVMQSMAGSSDQASNQASNIGRQMRDSIIPAEDIHFSSGARQTGVPLKKIEGEEGAKFILRKLHLTGNTIFSTHELSSFWESHMNQEVSVGELQKISQLVAQHYREQGYILAQVLLPEQDIIPAEGEITLQVLEGVLGSVRVEGGGPAEQKLVESQLEGMPLGKPFNENEVEERFLSIRKTPGLVIQPIFSPSKDQLGHTDLVFKIGARRYMDAGLSYNNMGNYYVGVHRVGLDAGVYNLVGRSKTKYNHLESTRKDLLTVDHIRQTQLIGNSGARAYLEYTNVVARPRLPDLNTNSYKYANLMFMYPLIFKRNSNLRIRFALDGQNDNSGYEGAILKNDHIRAGRMGLLYNYAGESDFWEVSTTFSHGYTGLLGGRATDHPSRAGGKNNFRHMIARGTWAHKINSYLSFMSMAGMQYSPDALLATEEFSVGSSNYLRGYDSTESTGDCGWGALTEMRFDTNISTKVIDSLQVYTSLGGAKVRNHRQKVDAFKHDNLLSFAVGLRGSLLKHIDYSLQAGKPLSRRASILSNKKWLYVGTLGLRFDLSKDWDKTVKAPDDPLEAVDD